MSFDNFSFSTRMCLTKDLVYQAEVITKEDDIKTYIGMTATTFKD